MHLYLNNKKKTDTKQKLNQIGQPIEVQYLVRRFGLMPNKLKSKTIGFWISLIDAFIITVTLYVSSLISNIVIIEVLIGAVIVFVLIFGINEIFGRILKRKGYDKK